MTAKEIFNSNSAFLRLTKQVPDSAPLTKLDLNE